MNATLAIAGREVRSLLRVPTGWVVTALYLLLTGLVFATMVLVPGEPATLRPFFGVSGWLLLPAAPAISMKLIAEERRAGTYETLLSSPVGCWSVAAGKWLGAMAFLVLMLAPTGLYVWALALASDTAPTPGPVVAGYTLLLLLGGAYLAVGLLASSITNNQTLAYLGTLLPILLVLVLTSSAIEALPGPVREPVRAMGIGRRIADFSRGVIDLEHVVFFVGCIALFVASTAAVLDARRWR